MNKVFLMGRLCQDPDVRRSNEGKPIARYILAVDRNKEETDFITCVAFLKNAEFAERSLRKGVKIIVEGRMHTGSYTDRSGKKVYTTDIIVDRHEFAESKQKADDTKAPVDTKAAGESFMDIPEEELEQLPFL